MESPRVAVVAPNTMPLLPHNAYGGSKRMVAELVETWSSDGNEPKVDLFCAEGSDVNSDSAKLHTFSASAYPEEFVTGTLGAEYLVEHPHEIDTWYKKSLANQAAYEDFVVAHIESDRPDIVNAHMHSPRLLGALSLLDVPLVVSLHNDPHTMELTGLPNGMYTALSDSQRIRTGLPPTEIATVNGGITLDREPDESAPDIEAVEDIIDSGHDFLLYVGAISRRKGVKTALNLALSNEMPLVIAGPVLPWSPNHLADTAGYFLKEIAPHIDNKNVTYLPSVNNASRNLLMKSADALVVASAHEDPAWQEAFGRIIPESLWQGTPVLASIATEGSTERLGAPCATRFRSERDELPNLHDVDAAACRTAATNLFDMRRYAEELRRLLYDRVEAQSTPDSTT